MVLVKTCGLQTHEAAQQAINHQADLLGVILVPGRSRTIDHQVAKQISQLVKTAREIKNPNFNKKEFFAELLNGEHTYTSAAEYYSHVQSELHKHGPFLVGVFQNQSVDDIKQIITETDIDIVQLHGAEDKLSYVSELLSVPVISRYLVNDLQDSSVLNNEILATGKHLLLLLDSEKGGDGKTLNWDLINDLNRDATVKFVLAGGLNCENVKEAVLKVNGVIGVDVSSGIETNKVKDLAKIETFIKNARVGSA